MWMRSRCVSMVTDVRWQRGIAHGEIMLRSAFSSCGACGLQPRAFISSVAHSHGCLVLTHFLVSMATVRRWPRVVSESQTQAHNWWLTVWLSSGVTRKTWYIAQMSFLVCIIPLNFSVFLWIPILVWLEIGLRFWQIWSIQSNNKQKLYMLDYD